MAPRPPPWRLRSPRLASPGLVGGSTIIGAVGNGSSPLPKQNPSMLLRTNRKILSEIHFSRTCALFSKDPVPARNTSSRCPDANPGPILPNSSPSLDRRRPRRLLPENQRPRRKPPHSPVGRCHGPKGEDALGVEVIRVEVRLLAGSAVNPASRGMVLMVSPILHAWRLVTGRKW